MRIILTKIKNYGLLEFSIMVLENFSTCFQGCETASWDDLEKTLVVQQDEVAKGNICKRQPDIYNKYPRFKICYHIVKKAGIVRP